MVQAHPTAAARRPGLGWKAVQFELDLLLRDNQQNRTPLDYHHKTPTRVLHSVRAIPCVARNHNARHMDSSLHEVWQAAAGSPFVPTVGKDSQFLIAFVLLVFGFFLGGAFTL